MKWFSICWGFIKSPTAMTVLAIVGFGLAIYQGFFYEKKGELTVTNDAASRVFDIYQPVGGLEVSYAGENLRISKKALWALSFTVKNSGNAEIKKGDYDDQVPFGFQFVGAEVVETPTIKTNVEYIAQNLKISKSKNFVGLSPVIFEPNDEVQINVLLLGSDTVKPIFEARGKVAGIRSITMLSPDKRDSGRGFWAKLTDADNLWVHPFRSLIYGIGGLLFVGLVFTFGAGISMPFEKFKEARFIARRRKEIATYKPNGALDYNSRTLIDMYISKGSPLIIEFAQLVEIIQQRIELKNSFKDVVSVENMHNILRKVHPIYPTPLLRKL